MTRPSSGAASRIASVQRRGLFRPHLDGKSGIVPDKARPFLHISRQALDCHQVRIVGDAEINRKLRKEPPTSSKISSRFTKTTRFPDGYIPFK